MAKGHALAAIGVGGLLTGLLLSTGPARSEPPHPADSVAERVGFSAARAAISPYTKVGKRTVEDWRQEVDAYWGPGIEAREQVRLFDRAWVQLDALYGAYMNLDVDMRALRRQYRPEIRDGVSQGRLVAIMNHLSLAMKDAHTAIMSRSVNWGTPVRAGTPLFVVGAWSNNASFGASLTPMPDRSLLVIRAVPNHPLGLEPGDLVLGYDGVPWSWLIPQLLAAELPIRLQWVWGSTDQSMDATAH